MQKLKAWIAQGIERLLQAPVLAPLYQITDEMIVLGGLAGGLVMLVVGLVLGARNRGFAGAVVGALSAVVAGLLLGALIGRLFARGRARIDARFELEGEQEAYSPKEVVSGYVHLLAEKGGYVPPANVVLMCRGFYVYDEPSAEPTEMTRLVRTTETYYQQSLPVVPGGRVRWGASLRYPFRIQLPDNPLPTNHGFGCSVRWSLHLEFEGEIEGEVQPSQEIIVRSATPIGVGIRPERAVVSASVGEMVLALPRAAYAEGETVRGRVVITPKETFLANEVRVLLLRVEHHPLGDNHMIYITGWNPETGRYRGESRPGGQGTTYVWLEDEADLAEDVRLAEGEKKLYDFALQLPQQWRPSFQTEHGEVSWRVVAVLARPNGGDLRVQQGILLHTGIPHIARVLASEASREE